MPGGCLGSPELCQKLPNLHEKRHATWLPPHRTRARPRYVCATMPSPAATWRSARAQGSSRSPSKTRTPLFWNPCCSQPESSSVNLKSSAGEVPHILFSGGHESCQIQRHSVWVVCCGPSPVHTEWHHKVHHWRPCARGGGGTQHQSQALWNLVHFLTTAWGLRCICVPAFHLHPAIVLVNLRDPRDVRIEACSRKAVRVSRDENRNTP